MSEINLIDHPFRRTMLGRIGREYRDFGYEYFDSPDTVTGFRGYRADGNAAEGRRDFDEEARFIGSIPGVKTVLDVGCAKGYLVKALRSIGCEAFGVDVSDYAVRAAEDDVRRHLRTMSVQELGTDERFDLVHVNGVLVYLTLSEIKRTLRRFHEISKIGIIVGGPTREQILEWYDAGDVSALDPLRKQEISQADWDGLIAEAGFDRHDGYYRRTVKARTPVGVAVEALSRTVEIRGG